MSLDPQLAALLPKTSLDREEGPIYFLWVFDPETGEVTLEHNEGRHAAEHVDHGHLAERVVHPDRVHGFAYKIRGGWRVTTWEHRPVDDPFILRKVKQALGGYKAAPRRHEASQIAMRALI